MCHHVNFQIRFLNEGFTTTWELTLVWPETTVLLQVIFEALLASVNFVATRKWANKLSFALGAPFSDGGSFHIRILVIFAYVFE